MKKENLFGYMLASAFVACGVMLFWAIVHTMSQYQPDALLWCHGRVNGWVQTVSIALCASLVPFGAAVMVYLENKK